MVGNVGVFREFCVPFVIVKWRISDLSRFWNLLKTSLTHFHFFKHKDWENLSLKILRILIQSLILL